MKSKIFTSFFSGMASRPQARYQLLMLLMLIIWGFTASGQPAQITARFANPAYDCIEQTYCVDVEFHADLPNLRLFQMNLRYFYETAALEYLSMTNFAAGYAQMSPIPAYINTGGGANWGFPGTGTLTYWNGAIQLENTGAAPVPLASTTNGWTRLFSICFKVLHPETFSDDLFCPSLIWDLEMDPALGGFGTQSDGIVITYLNQGTTSGAVSAVENVVQFNWAYDGTPEAPFGAPVASVCVPVDILPPVISEANGAATVACPALAVLPTPPTATDNCSGIVSAVYEGMTTNPAPLTCEGQMIYHFSYSDNAGNVATWTYTYTIERLDFAITTAPGAGTVACPAGTDAVPTPPVVNDNCGTPIIPTGPVVSAKPLCEGTRTYTWTYTDCEGNSHPWTYTYTVERADFTIAQAPGASTVTCPAETDVVPVPPLVTDACGNAITPTGPVASAKPVCEGTRTYTWTYTDCEGNSHPWVYTYTIEREDFRMPENTGTTVACAALAVAPVVPEVKDACGNTLTAPAPVKGGTYTACEGTITYTYTFTDCEGNHHDWVYTYTIEVAPFSISAAPGASTVQCASAAVAPVLPVVKDNCGNTLTPGTPVMSGTYVDCEGTKVFSYPYTDCEGNTATWTYTYTIDRTTAPAEAGGPVADHAMVNSLALAVPPALPVVKDVCGATLLPTGVTTSTTVDCGGTFKYVYTYEDCAGLTFEWDFTYTIERTTPPTQMGGPVPVASTVACPAAATPPTRLPLVEDVEGVVIQPTAASPSKGGTYNGCEGTVTYTYVYEDCAELLYVWTYTYTVEREDFSITAAPGASTVTCPAETDVVPAPPVVTDNCGNTLTPTGPVVSAKPVCEGTRTYTWTYTDCEGNSHPWVYTYTIEHNDFLMPDNGGSTVACAALAVAPVVPEVKDACGNILTAAAPVKGGTYTNCEGTITYTYTFTDCDGHHHDWVYTYTVEAAPFTISAADGAATVQCLSAAVAPALPEVKDNCGNLLTPAPAAISGTYTDCEGTRIYSYVYTDCEGNTDTWTFTYTIDRITPPAEFGVPVAKTMMVEDLADAVMPAVLPVVKDVCGVVLQPVGPVVSETGSCGGTKTYAYTYTDCAGLKFEWVFTYTIVRITPPAQVGGPVATSGTASCILDVTAPALLPVVKDVTGVTLNPTANSPVVEVVGNSCISTFKYTYTYADCAGLTYTWVYTVHVSDNVPPDFVVPADVTVQAGEDCKYDATPAITGIPTAVDDNCTVTPTVTYTDVIAAGPDAGTRIILRTWAADDKCGNITKKVQKITVIGGGELELVLNDYCVFINKYGKWTLSNWDIAQIIKGSSAACGTSYDLTVELSRRTFECKDVFGDVPVVVTVSDKFGNSKSGTINMQVVDTISPVAICRDIEVNLDANGQVFVNAALVNAGDDRESVPEWAKHYNDLEGGTYDNCGIEALYLSKQLFTKADVGTHEVILTAIDPSGNVGECTATITVKDPFAVPVVAAVANTAPTLGDIKDIEINKEPLSFDVNLGNITAGLETTQQITSVTAVSDNPGLLTSLSVIYQPGSTTGMLVVTVAKGMSGEALVTVTVKDDGGIQNGGIDTTVKSFRVKVTAGETMVGITLADPSGTPIVTDAIDLEADFGVELYPNPTRGEVNIGMTWNEIRDVEVRVYSMLGVEVFRKAYLAGDLIRFDLSRNVSGTYIVQLNVEGKSIIHKVILDRQE